MWFMIYYFISKIHNEFFVCDKLASWLIKPSINNSLGYNKPNQKHTQRSLL